MSTENLDRYRNTKTLNYELTTNNTNGKIGKIYRQNIYTIQYNTTLRGLRQRLKSGKHE